MTWMVMCDKCGAESMHHGSTVGLRLPKDWRGGTIPSKVGETVYQVYADLCPNCLRFDGVTYETMLAWSKTPSATPEKSEP